MSQNPIPYTDDRIDTVRSYHRIHANGERTYVTVVQTGERSYTALAFDIDPREFVPVAAECIAYDPTADGAVERARRWMEVHPKGIVGDDQPTGGWGSKLWGAIKRLDGYGNKLIRQQQEGAN